MFRNFVNRLFLQSADRPQYEQAVRGEMQIWQTQMRQVFNRKIDELNQLRQKEIEFQPIVQILKQQLQDLLRTENLEEHQVLFEQYLEIDCDRFRLEIQIANQQELIVGSQSIQKSLPGITNESRKKSQQIIAQVGDRQKQLSHDYDECKKKLQAINPRLQLFLSSCTNSRLNTLWDNCMVNHRKLAQLQARIELQTEQIDAMEKNLNYIDQKI